MSVNHPEGFVSGGVACGIKAGGGLDLALVATADGLAVPAAGVFTSNRAAAAPVQVSRRHLAASGGRAAAVVLSSGNANAATGAQGVADAEEMCQTVAAGIAGPGQPVGVVAAEHVLVCQTGLIGIALSMAPVRAGLPALLADRSGGSDAAARAARAIMTTDTVAKEAVVSGSGFSVGAMAKGAAMLAPNMATMLAVLTTDAVVEPEPLRAALAEAVAGSFNRLTIDGCTSTNDTVLVLANGRSGVRPEPAAITAALADACGQLARMMAEDAEGATKVAVVRVVGAAGDAEAERAARSVAESQLVQCSLNGADPYWGRVVSELGSAGVDFDLDRVAVAYGGVTVCRGGVAADHDSSAVAEHMAGRTVEIVCDLGLGSGSAAVLTTDLGYGYIDENRTTS